VFVHSVINTHMRYTELTELRRIEKERGAQNKLTELGHKAALEFLRDSDLDQFAVTMTSLPKVGVNPQSEYSTPLGIYFYPADYYVQQITAENRLPFQHNAKYINILKFTTNKILYVNKVTDIQPMIDRLSSITGLDQFVQNQFKRSSIEAKVPGPGGKLWYVMWALSAKLSADRKVSASVTWNWLIRKLGYDVVIDQGAGIIYSDEPTQGVIVNPSGTYSLAARFDNISEQQLAVKRLRNPQTSHADQLAIVEKDGDAIRYIANPIEAVQLAAVKQNGDAIRHIIKKFGTASEEVQLAAVRRDGWAIYHITNPSEAVQLAAVKQDVWAIEYITNPAPEVKNYVKKYGKIE